MAISLDRPSWNFLSFRHYKVGSNLRRVVQYSGKKIESNDALLLAFIVSYFLPVIARGVDMSFNAIVLLLFVITLLLWLISTIPAHPLLRVLRFRFYKLESSTGMIYTLISKREISLNSSVSPSQKPDKAETSRDA